jgi:hypothetical protein
MRAHWFAWIGLAVWAVAQTGRAEDGGPPRQEDVAVTEAASPQPGPRWPDSIQQRPLTLPRRMLRLDVGLDQVQVTRAFNFFGDEPISDLGLHVGAGYGVTDDVELGATLIPFQLTVGGEASGAWFGNMSVYGMARLTEGNVEVGARMALSLPTNTRYDLPDRPVVLVAGLPMVLRVGEMLRIDTGVHFSMHLRPQLGGGLSDLALHPPLAYPLPTRSTSGIPLVLTLSPLERLYMGLRTGVVIYDLTRADETTTMPLGFHIGWTRGASRSGPMVDWTFRFEWPFFINSGSNAVNTLPWQATFAASFYIDTL